MDFSDLKIGEELYRRFIGGEERVKVITLDEEKRGAFVKILEIFNQGRQIFPPKEGEEVFAANEDLSRE